MGFLKDIITRHSESRASSKRLVLVVSGLSLSICTIILSVAAFMGLDVSAVMWAVTTPLSALAGVSYVAKKEETDTQPDQKKGGSE